MKRQKARRLTMAIAVCLAVFSVSYAAFDFDIVSTTLGDVFETVADTTDPILFGNAAPVVHDVSAKTYQGIPVTLGLRASDEEGDRVFFRLTSVPTRGTISQEGGLLLYTPGKRGVDTFEYQAVDTAGNVSAPATVSVEVLKNKAKLTYSDMTGDPAHFAAVRLTEEGVIQGEKIGAALLLHPDKTVSRNEFLAMAVSAAKLRLPSEEAVKVSFLDAEEIPTWALPYVGAAKTLGVIQGFPAMDGTGVWRGQESITSYEASAILSRLTAGTEAQTVLYAPAESDLPAWAAASVLNVRRNIADRSNLLSALQTDGVLTRGEAVSLIYEMMFE